MLYSIAKNEIKDLSLEMIIYHMFKDYPKIIDGYNNNIIPILKEINELESINDIKGKLIWVNDDILLNWNNEETEKIFIEWIKKVYEWFEVEKNSAVNNQILSERISELKNEEFKIKNEDINSANNIINDFNF